VTFVVPETNKSYKQNLRNIKVAGYDWTFWLFEDAILTSEFI